MLDFIRNNILKILFAIIILIVIIVVVISFSDRPEIVSEETGYLEMENKIQNAAINFTKKNRKLLPTDVDIPKKIKLETLIKNNYLNEFHAVENSRVTCTGYVYIEKKKEDEEDYRYTPHIKCGKYYETRTIAEHIIENEPIVNTGEGLYKISLGTNNNDQKDNKEEKNKYYYKGEYPNNYIMLGERKYRIIEITEDNNLKVISPDRTPYSYLWDDRYNNEYDKYCGINDFSKSRIKESLEELYELEEGYDEYSYFSDEEKNFMIEHDFCVGKRSEDDYNIYSDSECKVTESLKVGLITVSEYYKASISSDCKEIGDLDCNNYNFMFSLRSDGSAPLLLTLTADADNSRDVYSIADGDYYLIKSSSSKKLYPVFYMDSNILYKSGTGTSDDPYIVR